MSTTTTSEAPQYSSMNTGGGDERRQQQQQQQQQQIPHHHHDDDTTALPSSSLLHLSPRVKSLKSKLDKFVETRCIPTEKEFDDHLAPLSGADRWSMKAVPPCVERLSEEAKSLGLWNLFLPPTHPLPPSLTHLSPSTYLTNREYGILCESMGRSFLAPVACNCSAPDTGNMEVLLRHGTPEQQERYLKPLLEGRMRSCFLMTEPGVASSDATNIETTLTKITTTTSGVTRYELNGRKWWSTGAMDPRCRVALVLARTAVPVDVSSGKQQQRRHGAHTVCVIPMNSPGVKLVRPLTVFGYDDAPHGHAEVVLDGVTFGEEGIVLGDGRGFEIAQSRLGPGRIHHCMRAVGLAARCYELMLERSLTRSTFGKTLSEHGMVMERIADAATDVEAARLLTLSCAVAIDEEGANQARDKIAMIKVAVPELTLRVADAALQVFGGAGVSDDFPLARAVAGLRSLRIADGPDAVHKRTVAIMEIKKAKKRMNAMKRSRL